jgi:hypothetical protein
LDLYPVTCNYKDLHMLKKSLIAFGVAVAAGAVHASDSTITSTNVVSSANPTIGVEGMSGTGAPTSFSPASIVYTISSANAYNTANKVNVGLTGGTFGLGTSVVAVQSSGTSKALTVTYNGTNNSFSLSGLASDSIADGSTITLSGLEVVPSSTTAGSVVSLTVEMLSSLGVSIDSATGKLGTFIDQLSSKVTGTLGDKVDVSKASKVLVGGSDAISVQFDFTKADYNSLSAPLVVSSTLNGDFGWLYNASNALIATSVTSGGYDFTSAAKAPFLSTAFSVSNADVSTAFTVNFTPSTANGVLPTTEYKTDLAITSGTTTLDSKSDTFKSWTLNGSDVTIPYLPFGSAYAQSITMTNSGSVVGDITATFTANGKTYDAVSVGTAAAKSVTNVGSAVNAAATALGLKDAQVQLTVTSPSTDIEVVAIYYSKADGDRVQTYSSNTVVAD